MTRLPYASDLNDAEWVCIAPYIEQKPGPGRKRTIDSREVVNALCYLSKTGCQWRMLPHDVPPWTHVAYYYYQWIYDGTLEDSNDCLREDIRIALGRDAEPSVTIIDSQSVKTASHGEERGYDTAKQVKGRKRHLMVATLGLLVLIIVTAASVQDSDVGQALLIDVRTTTRRLQKVYADQGYKAWLVDWILRWKTFLLEIVTTPPDQVGFQVHPKRWIVERTCAWFGNDRRLSKDYDRTVVSSEGMIRFAAMRHMVRKLARLRYQMHS